MGADHQGPDSSAAWRKFSGAGHCNFVALRGVEDAKTQILFDIYALPIEPNDARSVQWV
jgi:hypothetical protein